MSTINNKQKAPKATFFDYYNYIAENADDLSYEEIELLSKVFEAFGEKLEFSESEEASLYREKQKAVGRIVAKKREEREQAAAQIFSTGDGKSGYYELNLQENDDELLHENGETETISCADALIRSLDRYSRVDMDFISRLSGKSVLDVIRELGPAVFQNPARCADSLKEGWETSDEYLSGNIPRKLKEAKQAEIRSPGRFSENIRALRACMPPEVGIGDIYVTLGSPFVPCEVIDDFILHLVGIRKDSREASLYDYDCCRTVHDDYTGIWEIPYKSRFHGISKYRLPCESVYGTERMEMLTLLENTLNQRTPEVFDSTNGGRNRLYNENETVKLVERQRKLIAEFEGWVWLEPTRAEQLKAEYNKRFCNLRRRVFNGDFLSFPGMDPAFSLYDYQKNAVARILCTKNTLLAHDVGAGKTNIMIAAGMELRRQGRSKKNLYVVPNSILGQWKSAFFAMYPSVKLFTVDKKNFSPSKREETLKTIRDGDFDAILMAYSSFDMLPLSRSYYMGLCREALDSLAAAKEKFSLKGKIGAKEKKIRARIDALLFAITKERCEIRFDELGINTLFLDEAHYYKNVPIESEIRRVSGINQSGSEKCRGMMDKVMCVQRQNEGGRIVFATGTPVTNSLTDIFVLQKYLQNGELTFAGLHNFDSWVGMFAEKTHEFEIDVDTASYRLKTRFARFKNLPELSALFSSVADFHMGEPGEELPRFDGYTDSVAEGSGDFKRYLAKISERADAVREGKVKSTEDNMLKITTDGRKAALDMRLIDEKTPAEPDAKVKRCACEISRIYAATRECRGVQLVFCDSSTPKEGFNLYHELKRQLCNRGIHESKIAFIHEAQSDTARESLFEKLRQGEVAVLIGSTLKTGHGVNIQDRLVALHHLDVPWRPADMVQREGRILRRGNRSEKVEIYRYITKGSFDAYSWQLLEAKQRFISQILLGSCRAREGSDIDHSVLGYAEVKALAVGNPKIKHRVELANTLAKYRILERDAHMARLKAQKELSELPERIRAQGEAVKSCELDIAECAECRKASHDAKSLSELRTRIKNGVRIYVGSPLEAELGEYRGFRVIVPPYMKPRTVRVRDEQGRVVDTERTEGYVCLVRNGRYFVTVGEERGILKRLDNLIDGLETRLGDLEKALENLRAREESLKSELTRGEDYKDIIASLQESLDKLDNELGIKEAS